jgi:hypothetical protein
MKCVGNGGSTLVISLETISVYLDAVNIKAPCAELFAPMGFDADSRIYMAGALEYIAAEVLDLSFNTASWVQVEKASWYESDDDVWSCGGVGGGGCGMVPERKEVNEVLVRDVVVAVDGDLELMTMGRRVGWELVFIPERVKMNLPSHAIGNSRVMRTLALLVGRDDNKALLKGSLVSKTWYSIYENEAKEELKSDEAKEQLVRRFVGVPFTSMTERFKAQVLLRMGPIADAFPKALVGRFVREYIRGHFHSVVTDYREISHFPSEDSSGRPIFGDWIEKMITKFDIKSFGPEHWPEELQQECNLECIQEYHGSNTQFIAGSVSTMIGALCPNLESITLCGVPCARGEYGIGAEYQATWENADDMVPAINALATTNPSLTSIDMDTVPTNDNVVNAIGSAFPQLTSFSATNRAHGETISDAALDALRASHPGITITIRTWSEDE